MATVLWDMEGILTVERFSLFDRMQDGLRGSGFNDDLQIGVRESMHTAWKNCLPTAFIRKLTGRRQRCTDVSE
jgi:hypothetical protein